MISYDLNGLPLVPYQQERFNLMFLESVRDRDSLLHSGHLREGIVIRSEPNEYGIRKIAKMISPKYLLRKGDGTEYN